jgi:hypothetical protein
MRRRVLCVLTISLFLILGPANAQTLVPTTTYTLHAQKEQHSSNLPSTLVYLLPNQALLVLIPQPDGKWVFKRLTAWATGSPKEESLAFTTEPPHEGTSGYEDLKVDPSGFYVVIRVKSFSGDFLTATENRSAVVVLVDLRSFTVVSQRMTSDPLLAASDWSFADNGTLVASVMTGRSMTPPHPKHTWSWETIADTYQAAALSLPDLKASMPCQYELFVGNRTGSLRRDRYLSKVSDGCAALVELAHVPTAENLPDGPPKPVPFATLAGPTCEFGTVSPSANFALYGCRTGHDYADGMIVTTNTRNLTVLSLPDGKPVLTVPLPHNTTPYPSLLADAGNHTWLLILRDGIKLEAYRLP